jgi:hypothetical protein
LTIVPYLSHLAKFRLGNLAVFVPAAIVNLGRLVAKHSQC